MTADHDRSTRPAAVRTDFPLLVLAGFLIVAHDFWMSPAPATWLNPHWLFAVLLSAWIAMRFYRRMHQAPRMQPNDIRAFSRHLSRLVYLLLYLLMLLSLSLRFVRHLIQGTGMGTAEDFQAYLAGGVMALITIHALAALCRHLDRQSAHALLMASGKRTADVAGAR
jgi:cytochrome b561